MSEADDWNAKSIEEFRANDGKVGGQFAGDPKQEADHPGLAGYEERTTRQIPVVLLTPGP